MGNYAERDRRHRETIEWARRVRIAERIAGLGAAKMESVALWLFCRWCGHRRLADAEWFYRRVPDVPDPLEHLQAKLWCTGCDRQGVLLIVAPSSARSLPINFFKPEGRALLLTDQD